MSNNELELLMNEYRDADSKEDTIIWLKLNNIASLCANCDPDEFIFANEITSEFCRLIRLLKEQHKKDFASDFSVYRALTDHPAKSYQKFVSEKRNCVQYECGNHLLGAFYNHYKKESEIDYYAIDTYPFADEEDRKEKVNVTLKDYVARIYTFANKYLPEVFSAEELAASCPYDPILFIYDNIEFILAKFNTKDDNGESIKQKVNIRSALRKLNEYKRLEESR